MKKILLLFSLVICFTAVKAQIPLSGFIKTIGDSDTYPVTLDSLQAGGYHTTYSITTRDAIPSARRKVGMMVRVSSIDSTYVLVGGITNANWQTFSSGVDANVLSDSLANYTPLQDGLVSGGEATIGAGSVTIDTAVYRINRLTYTSLPRTFTGITNSPSGTQYYLVVYGEIGGTLDTISGARDTIAVIPDNPINTVKVNTVLVGDGGVESTAPDLSGYALLSGDNLFNGNQLITNGIVSLNGNFKPMGLQTEVSDILNVNSNFRGINLDQTQRGGAIRIDLRLDYPKFQFLNRNSNSSDEQYVYTIDSLGNTKIGYNNFSPAIYRLDVNGNSNLASGFNYLINGSKLNANNVDTLSLRTVSNSYSLSSGQPRLVSGTNIKTINGNSLLSSGNLLIDLQSVTTAGNTTTTGANFGGNITVTGVSGTVNMLKSQITSGNFIEMHSNGINAEIKTSGNVPIFISDGTTAQTYFTGGNVGIGNSSPSEKLTVTGNGLFSGTTRASNFGAGIAPNTAAYYTSAINTTTIGQMLLTPSATDYTGTVSGMLWNNTSELKFYDGTISSVNRLLKSSGNALYVGTGVRALTSNATGDVAATTPILETYTTDTDVITALTGATYSPTATLTPANSKVFYKGQLYYASGSMYFATADNVALKTDATRTQITLASGNGSSTTISIPHGLSYTPFAIVQAGNTASAGITYTDTDATNINLYYSVAPASGTNNLRYKIIIK